MRFLVLPASICLALPGLTLGADSPADRCAGLYSLSDADHAVESGVLVSATDDTPPHCRVRGTIDGTIRFEIRMPAEGWTGRFMFHAPGGLAGVIGDTSSLLDDGFAMATTDTGHESENDPSFYRDAHAKLNFAFRANHLTTVLSKRIIQEFYGRPVQHAYLWGCSNGGRAALVEALRYPDDYDGIIAGAPAIDYGHGLLAWALEVTRHQGRNPLTPESVVLLEANTRRACDLLDGVADGLVGDPRKCTVELLELDALECRNGPAADCLTAGQIETARYVYTGITDESGAVVVPGVYPGGELGGDFELWVTGPVPFLEGTASDTTVEVLEAVMHRKPGFSIETFDPVRDLDELKDTMVSVDIPAPDFSRFQESGGKLIIYNGWHDQPCRARALEGFLAEAEELNGEGLDDYLRAFLAPGMVHCLGGPGAWAADYVQAIVDWVESDTAPDRIIAEHPGNFTFMEGQVAIAGRTVSWSEAILEAGEALEDRKRFSRPLCPYPQYARYSGSGDANDAENYACVED